MINVNKKVFINISNYSIKLQTITDIINLKSEDYSSSS